MKPFALITGSMVLGIAAVLYLGDGLILRLRSQPYETVTVQHYFAIAQKTGKVQLQFDRTYDQPCAKSLFPHAGRPPCWYLKRHTEQWTRI
jgi:hypothetical protein